MKTFMLSLSCLLFIYVAPLPVIEYIANLLETGLVTIFDFYNKNAKNQFET